MDFVALRKIFLPISGVIAVISIALLFAPGLNLGIDFVSGTSSTYDFGGGDPGTEAVNDALVASGHPEAIVQTSATANTSFVPTTWATKAKTTSTLN